ncbi:MAG: ParA family protein, partial [Clostridia bacterium]|nr:ParA family protein [Clostridia bacterium]
TAPALRLLGGALLALGGGLLGQTRLSELQRQRDALRALSAALGRLAAELELLQSPLGAAFSRLTDCPFFRQVAAGFLSRPLETLWRETAAAQPLPEEARRALAPLKQDYDFIFLDCPPSLGLITLNALCAVDTVLVPIQCEYYALEGLSQLMGTIRQVKRRYNGLLELEGVLLTMYDGRLNLTQQVVQEVKRFFPQKVYATVIPRNVRLSEAPSFGQPVWYYDKSSRGAQAYDALAAEFLKKNGK